MVHLRSSVRAWPGSLAFAPLHWRSGISKLKQGQYLAFSPPSGCPTFSRPMSNKKIPVVADCFLAHPLDRYSLLLPLVFAVLYHMNIM